MKQTGQIKNGNGITWKQFYMLNGLWTTTATMRGWKPSDRAKRLEVFSEALGRSVASAKELGFGKDVDKVKRHLEKLSERPRTSLSPGQAKMLDDLFRAAVQTHCQRQGLETLTPEEVEQLRHQWLTEALGESSHAWEYLCNAEIDRLKPFLIWQADPDNETKRAAVATAAVDGQTRVVIAAILAKVLCLRRVAAWLDRQFEDVDLSPESLDDYVHSISTDTRAHANWRGLLLPILEEVLVTVEERRREHVRLLKLMYGEEEAKGLLKLLETYPDQYAAITTKYVASVEPYRTLAFAREKRAAVRAEARKRKAAPSAPARLSAYLKPTATPDSRHETQDLPANADDVPFTNQF